MVSLVAASALDAHTSTGRYESNPLLRDSAGRFHPGKGALIKSASSGGSLLLQALLFRSKRDDDLYKPAALVNFTCAGVLGGVAFSNSRVPKAAAALDYLRAL